MKSKKLSEVIIKTFKNNGFALSEPDVLLDSDYIIERSGEKFRSSMLTFDREDGKTMCLRPDLTVASCISFLQKKTSSKIYYSGQAYRRSGSKGANLINDQLINTTTTTQTVIYTVVATTTANGCSSPSTQINVFVNPLPIVAPFQKKYVVVKRLQFH